MINGILDSGGLIISVMAWKGWGRENFYIQWLYIQRKHTSVLSQSKMPLSYIRWCYIINIHVLGWTVLSWIFFFQISNSFIPVYVFRPTGDFIIWNILFAFGELTFYSNIVRIKNSTSERKKGRDKGKKETCWQELRG